MTYDGNRGDNPRLTGPSQTNEGHCGQSGDATERDTPEVGSVGTHVTIGGQGSGADDDDAFGTSEFVYYGS